MKFRYLLRNKFNFWNVHGIMNTSGLLLLIFTFYYKYLKYKKILGIKTVMHLKYNCINGLVGV